MGTAQLNNKYIISPPKAEKDVYSKNYRYFNLANFVYDVSNINEPCINQTIKNDILNKINHSKDFDASEDINIKSSLSISIASNTELINYIL